MAFIGCIADKSSGLYYMNARYYNPKTGRFLTQDAMGGDQWTNNLYAYCGNNPVSFIDPTGHSAYLALEYMMRAKKQIKAAGGKTDHLDKSIKYVESVIEKEKERVIVKGRARIKGVVSREDWGAADTKKEEAEYIIGDLADYYDTVVLHHTDRSQNEDMKSLQAEDMNTGSADSGYHFVISGDGTIYEARPINIMGAHVKDNNSNKIGVALMGNLHNDGGIIRWAGNLVQGANATDPTDAQISSLKYLLGELDKTYGINNVVGHRDVALSSTACPGDRGYEYFKNNNIFR